MANVRVGLFPTVAPLIGGEELRTVLAPRRRSASTISASAIM